MVRALVYKRLYAYGGTLCCIQRKVKGESLNVYYNPILSDREIGRTKNENKMEFKSLITGPIIRKGRPPENRLLMTDFNFELHDFESPIKSPSHIVSLLPIQLILELLQLRLGYLEVLRKLRSR